MDFEGPPSPDDMSGIARECIRIGNLDRAREIADVMIEHWQFVTGEHGARRFYWWLGLASAVACMQVATVRRAA